MGQGRSILRSRKNWRRVLAGLFLSGVLVLMKEVFRLE
jgi:hypothetical protein